MKKLLALILLAASTTYATFPTNETLELVDIDKVDGNWNQFRQKWRGDETQKITFGFDESDAAVNLTGFNTVAKLSQQRGTAQVTYIVDTNLTVSTSNAIWNVSATNIPPNGRYLCEIRSYQTGTTGPARTLAQGKVQVVNSLYASADDSTFPWPTTSNLADYLQLAGGTMTGLITLSGAPTANLHAATKLYVDAVSTAYIAADTVVSNGVTTAFTAADVIVSNGVTTAFGAADAVVTAAYVAADVIVSNGVTTAFGAADAVVTAAYIAADVIVSNGVTTAFTAADVIVSNGVSTAFAAADATWTANRAAAGYDLTGADTIQSAISGANIMTTQTVDATTIIATTNRATDLLAAGDITLTNLPNLQAGTINAQYLEIHNNSGFSIEIQGESVLPSSGVQSGVVLQDNEAAQFSYHVDDGNWHLLGAVAAVGSSGASVKDIRNVSGDTITNGYPVYASGFTANRTTVALADQDTLAGIGVMITTLANNRNGEIATSGELTGLDTSSNGELITGTSAVGANIYLAANGAARPYTIARPSVDGIQKVGIVTRVHASAGVIQIVGAGRFNDVPAVASAMTITNLLLAADLDAGGNDLTNAVNVAAYGTMTSTNFTANGAPMTFNVGSGDRYRFRTDGDGAIVQLLFDNQNGLGMSAVVQRISSRSSMVVKPTRSSA